MIKRENELLGIIFRFSKRKLGRKKENERTSVKPLIISKLKLKTREKRDNEIICNQITKENRGEPKRKRVRERVPMHKMNFHFPEQTNGYEFPCYEVSKPYRICCVCVRARMKCRSAQYTGGEKGAEQNEMRESSNFQGEKEKNASHRFCNTQTYTKMGFSVLFLWINITGHTRRQTNPPQKLILCIQITPFSMQETGWKNYAAKLIDFVLSFFLHHPHSKANKKLFQKFPDQN